MNKSLFVKKFAIASIASLCLTFTACNKDDDDNDKAAERPDLVFYALTEDGKINKYNAKTPENADASYAITGLQTGEKILSIDFRPATGQLFGLGSTSRLYTINYGTGAALAVGGAAFTPALASQVANIDFNPTVDRIRLVTNSGQNLRLHPELGTVAATDGSINGGSSPSITSIAYTNSMAGAATTTLYDIDVTTRKLYKQEPPNDGTLAEVGTLNVNFTGKGGFDIISDNSIALATFTVDGKSKLYTVDVNNAGTTFLADFNANIVDIAIPLPARPHTQLTRATICTFLIPLLQVPPSAKP